MPHQLAGLRSRPILPRSGRARRPLRRARQRTNADTQRPTFMKQLQAAGTEPVVG